MTKITKFVPIAKVDKTQQIVWGYASTPALDSDDEIISLEAMKAALPAYMKWGNVREMHKPSAVGVALKGSVVDEKGLWFGAKIVDPLAWAKVQEGVYKGFSIGGEIVRKVGKTIEELDLVEISVVDRPANEECRIEVVKMQKTSEAGAVVTNGTEATPVGEDIDAPEPEVVLTKSEKRGLLKFFAKLFEDEGSAPVIDLSAPIHKKDKQPDEPYGDVEYADPGYQSDGKKRYPVDTPKHIRSAWSYIHKPGNRTPYTAEQLSHIEAKITSAWKEHVDADGPPSAEKSATLVVDSKFRMAYDRNNELTKSMYSVHGLVNAFDGIRNAQRDRKYESQYERDPSDGVLESELGQVANRVAQLIARWALHEGQEALSETDVLDEEEVQEVIIVENVQMPKTDLTKRVSSRAKAHMAKAAHHLGELHKCMKAAGAAAEALNNLHMEHAKAHKAAGDGAEFDHAGAMEHLHKIRTNHMKAEDHHEMALHHLECCDYSQGEGTVDAEGYDGHIEHDGMPTDGDPLLNGQGDQSNKGKKAPQVRKSFAGMTDEQIAAYVEQQTELAALRSENELLKAMPAGVGKVVPSFNLAKHADASGIEFTPGEGDQSPEAKRAALVKGLDRFDINNQDEKVQSTERARAVGKAIGNMLSNPGMFGANPIFDPNFRGAAAR